MSRRITSVLFDLDGTLADTAPDLAGALNQVLREQGREPLPFDTIRPVVSHGGIALINLGFDLTPEDEGFAPLRERLLAIYRADIARETQLFPGMAEVLDELEAQGLSWGVITNKPAWLTEPLLEALGLRQRAATVVSGDTLPQRKPHPAPMHLACREAGADPQACVYVGDAARDIEAGRVAGMATLVALWGYIGEHDRPHDWGADAAIETPGDILDWIRRTEACDFA